MNTAMFNPPKQMGNNLANPQEQPEPETASEEDENVSSHTSYTLMSVATQAPFISVVTQAKIISVATQVPLISVATQAIP